jgi:hypothetical protein
MGNSPPLPIVGTSVRRLLGAVGVAAALAACGSGSSSSSYGGNAPTTAAPVTTAPATTVAPIASNPTAPLAASCTKSATTAVCPPDPAALPAFVGLTEQQAAAQAAANGWPFRVAERDGEQLMLTQDYNEERVNVAVQTGKVTRAWFG